MTVMPQLSCDRPEDVAGLLALHAKVRRALCVPADLVEQEEFSGDRQALPLVCDRPSWFLIVDRFVMAIVFLVRPIRESSKIGTAPG